MNYTENYKGIKLDIQAIDISLGAATHKSIRAMLDKMGKYSEKINWADVYMKKENASNGLDKFVRIRLGIPGPDVFAEDTGEHWETTIRSVGDKIERQLRKANSK